MQYEHFIGQVQRRARVASDGEAVKAIRATLETLAQRIQKEEAEDLAVQLPEEIGQYLQRSQGGESFDLREFFEKVGEKEGTGVDTAIAHAKAVVSVLMEAVASGEIGDVRSQLGPHFDPLFESPTEGRA
ncbi:MAG: DUF2267 domain-containing protein [Syntrophotaleaceae bacterium]